MKIVLSYSGGTSRGIELAREFERLGYLSDFYIPKYNHRDIRNIRRSYLVLLLRAILWKSRGLRRAKPTERYWMCEAHDRWTASRLKKGADILIAEGQIGLHTIRKAKEMGMVTVVDRTNSHIIHQSEIWGEENKKMGIHWKPNSERVVRKGILEYQEADYTFVLSSFVAATFLERGYPKNKLVHVLPGINLEPFRTVEKKDSIFRIVFCGLTSIKKGVHYLLQAFGDLNLMNSELMLIGGISSEMQPILEKCNGNFKLAGQIERSELYRYYSQGSVFVLPSLEEGLAKVIIEAMACGLPVIATANSGAGDVVREGVDGFIVPIRNVDALKEKILYMYKNQDQCRSMGRNAIERVHSEFTLERYMDRMLAALNRICPDRT